MMSRRRLLIGGGATAAAAAVAGVETGLLPGRSLAYHYLGLDGPDGRVPDVEPVPTESGSFRSARRGGVDVGWTIARPEGAGALPAVVVLHGRDKDHTAAFDPGYLAMDRFLAAAIESGVPPFGLASIDGGDSYWHARDNGDDPIAMIADELVPLLAERGLDTSRLGVLGWSMGGFGALHLGGVVSAVSAIGVMSPALFRHYDDARPGAFDDAEQFDSLDLFERRDELADSALRVDCGEGDPFYNATRDYVAGFDPRPDGGFQHGDHDLGYWRRMLPAQLAFLGRSLSG